MTNQTKPALLVVDDEKELAVLLESFFSGHGFEVTVVCDGLSALRQSLRTQFDVIITDVNLPQLTGDEFVTIIRNSSINSKTFIIAMSGIFTDGVVSRLARVGGVELFTKPFKCQEMLAKIKEKVSLHLPSEDANFEGLPFQKQFSKAIETAFTANCNNEFEIKSVLTGNVKPGRHAIAANIPIYSKNFHGCITLGAEILFARTFLNLLFTPEQAKDMSDHSAAETTGELLNQIAGNFKSILLEEDKSILIGIPNVYLFSQLPIQPMISGSTIQVRGSLSLHPCRIDFTYCQIPA